MARVSLDPYFPKDISNLILSYNGPTKEKELIFKLQKRKMINYLKNDSKLYPTNNFYVGYFRQLQMTKLLNGIIGTLITARYSSSFRTFSKLCLRATTNIDHVKFILDKCNYIKFSSEKRKLRAVQNISKFVEESFETCECLTQNGWRCKNKSKFNYSKYLSCSIHLNGGFKNCYSFYKSLDKKGLYNLENKYAQYYRY